MEIGVVTAYFTDLSAIIHTGQLIWPTYALNYRTHFDSVHRVYAQSHKLDCIHIRDLDI
jgi:hypothetical protein